MRSKKGGQEKESQKTSNGIGRLCWAFSSLSLATYLFSAVCFAVLSLEPRVSPMLANSSARSESFEMYEATQRDLHEPCIS